MSCTAKRRFFRHGLLPQLIVFEAVARLGSVTRAAEELHLAQPTVSIQIKKLAETLGVTLFEPDGRRRRLTAAGRALREICDELVQCLTRADAKLDAFRGSKAEQMGPLPEAEIRAAASAVIAAFCASATTEDLCLFAARLLDASAGGANNAPAIEEMNPWSSRATTTRQLT
jgi:LysR family transcriptional regulator, low CO2-responsive transcriptional regulator